MSATSLIDIIQIFVMMKSTGIVIASVLLGIHAVKRGSTDTDCPPYDSMHVAGGPIAPCTYTPNIVFNMTIGENDDVAFGIDGSHLASKGAMAYLKERNTPQLSEEDFMKCDMNDCSDLGTAR
jgi:hypothetical protein